MAPDQSDMKQGEMRILLEAILKAAQDEDMARVRDMASAGLTMLNGSISEASDAWREIQRLKQ